MVFIFNRFKNLIFLFSFFFLCFVFEEGVLFAEAAPSKADHIRYLMHPTVQLKSAASVGTGVLLKGKKEGPEGHSVFVLTAWHVVRDIQHDQRGSIDKRIPILSFEGESWSEKASLVAFNEEADLALLEIPSFYLKDGFARLPARGTYHLSPKPVPEKDVRFQSIWAIGCPLGQSPKASKGIISSGYHQVGDLGYYMISAPTHVGNSGGGVFSSETLELVGIFSKIYTYRDREPIVVPHLGAVTPMDVVYDFLEETNRLDLLVLPDSVGRAATSKGF